MNRTVLVRKREILIFIAIFMYSVAFFLKRVNLPFEPWILNKIMTAGALLSIVNICFDKKISIRKFLLSILIGCLLLIDSLPTGNHELLYLFFIIWGSRNIDKIKVIRYVYSLILSLTVLVAFSVAFGLIKNEIFVQNGMRLRYGMGYNLWSILPFQFFSLCMIYMLLQEKKVKIYKVILMCIVAIYIGVMTDTKTSVFATLLCTFLLYCIQSKKFINWNHLNWMVGIPIILVIISLFATYAYATEIPIFVKIDKILNHRLMYQAIGLNEYGVHLLSNPEVQYIVIGNDYFALDNLYINLLVKWGIVATVIFLLIFSYLIKYCINVRNIKLLCIVTFMCLMAIVWSRLLVFIEAEFLVCFGEVFSKRYEQRKI